LLQAVEDISSTKKRLRIEIPSDVIEKEIENSLEKLRQKAKIPGFRPGRAPINLIEKRFGKEVEAEVLDKIIPEHLSSAIREADIKPVTIPVLDEKFSFKRNNPVNLSITIEVLPKIENLNYENINVKDIPFSVDDSDIEDTLKRLQDQKAVLEVSDKEVQMDDLVTFEYVDSEIIGEEIGPSVKELISGMGNEIFPHDIMEKVLGKKKGDTIEFTTTFSKEISKELAGKTANIKLKINEIKKKSLPAIDDEFAKDLGFENLPELKEKMREKIYRAKKEQVQKIQKAEIINMLIENNKLEVPETLLNRELESLILQESLSDEGYKPAPASEERSGMQDTTPLTPPLPRGEFKEGHHESGIMHPTLEEAGSLKGEKDVEDLQAKLKQKAFRNVQASIIIDAIGQKEGISITDQEVNDQISLIAQRLSATPEAVKNFYKYKEGSLEGLRHSIFEEKVMDMLLSKATINKKLNLTTENTEENKNYL